MSSSSLLQTALQNLHVSQQLHLQQQQSQTPRAPSSSGSARSRGDHEHEHDHEHGQGHEHEHEDESVSSMGGSVSASDIETDEDEMVDVGKGTRPGTPVGTRPGTPSGRRLGGGGGSALVGKSKEPLRTLPTHLAVRMFLQLDIKSLARCDRVCKRWHKSSTLNYVWFLHNRALLLPRIAIPDTPGGKTRTVATETFFDPYDKAPRLSTLPTPPIPTSLQPQWTKVESKRAWRATFKSTFKRSDPSAEPEVDSRRVDIASLQSSGASTPGGHGYAGLGSGGAAKWGEEGTAMTKTEIKMAKREEYKSMGGRKSRGKRRMGGDLGGKDKGGAMDGRFDAPW